MNALIDPKTHTEAFTAYLSQFKKHNYVLPRYTGLETGFNSVLAQFVSSRMAEVHFEGRGLVLTAGTRSGKTHDLKELLNSFSDDPSELGGGLERKSVHVSLRATTSWKHLGSALLKATGYFSDLDHRSADLIWRRTESQLMRNGVSVIHIDEAQHLFYEKKSEQIKTILAGLKDLMKRPDWPVLLILSGVPTLLEFLNASDELVALLEPISYGDIAYNSESLEEVDAILCAFAEVAEIDVSTLRNEEVYNRMIHATARRWGRLIELVIHSLAYAKASSKVELSNADLADTFRRWTGAADGANVFLVENPYRIKAHMLYPS
ncbi:ATP-binding protein [Thalassospira alkalitolerans]|uniref:ATP-binding protein n=1 Tax=Thalassospira alkalitolerans TaxID=1293890 RepID=UPI003AA80E5B